MAYTQALRLPAGSVAGPCAIPTQSTVFSVCTQYGTLNAMAETVPVRELRNELAAVIDRVADLREHIVITRRGRPAAVLIPVDEYDALEETAEILSDTDTLAAIEQGMREVERGETVTLAELKAELRRRRRRG